jgi:hypothetical protein
MSQRRSCVSEIGSASDYMALLPAKPNVIASQFASTLRPLSTAPHACPLASGRVGMRVSQFPWRGLISITRLPTYLRAAGRR